jgi:NADH:ubiquinone oxidoreductase subunit E
MLSEENQKKVEELRKRYPTSQALVLPVLWIVQEQEGYISEDSMKYVAALLHIPFGHILGVVSFYTMLQKDRIGKHHIEVCSQKQSVWVRAEPLRCWLSAMSITKILHSKKLTSSSII